MPNIKGKRKEAGIWLNASGKGYLAEVNVNDPQTGRRLREQKSFRRIDLAREWRQTRKADALRGEIRGKKDKLPAKRFDAFADEYLKQWSKLHKRESSYIRDQTSIKQLNPVFGRKYLNEITRRDVEGYISARSAAGRAPATVNRELCCLKNMLRKAVDWGYLKENPAWGIKQMKENPPEFAFLTFDEIDRLIEATSGRLKTFFTLAVHTGMRLGELLKLEWRDVDFNKGEQGFITVRDAKNHETRHVPMNSVVRTALHKYPQRIVNGKRCVHVFTNDDGTPYRSVKDGFVTALKLAGIERHVRFHDLRHTFASHLVMKGVDIRTVAKLMGHKDIKMTMRYAHLAPDHLQTAVDVLSRPREKVDERQANA